MEPVIEHPYTVLLEAARRMLRAYGSDEETQAVLELTAAVGEIDLLIDRQKRARGELEPPDWLNR